MVICYSLFEFLFQCRKFACHTAVDDLVANADNHAAQNRWIGQVIKLQILAKVRAYLGFERTLFAIGERNKILSAERITRDRRILPKGYDEEKYAFRVPDGAAFPITVAAKLNYRSMSQAFANIFYPDGSLAVPVLRMAEGGYAFGKPAVKAAAAP